MSDSSDLPDGAQPTSAQVLPFEPRGDGSLGNGAVGNRTPSTGQVQSDRVYIVSSTAMAAESRASKFDFVKFDRSELDLMLGVYGRRVAKGEWRDYAIDMLKDRAVFSIFRRTAEMPIYRIEKNPKLARKQGAYCVVSAAGTVLKRGQDLKQVLRVLERKSKVVSL